MTITTITNAFESISDVQLDKVLGGTACDKVKKIAAAGLVGVTIAAGGIGRHDAPHVPEREATCAPAVVKPLTSQRPN